MVRCEILKLSPLLLMSPATSRRFWPRLVINRLLKALISILIFPQPIQTVLFPLLLLRHFLLEPPSSITATALAPLTGHRHSSKPVLIILDSGHMMPLWL